jgi:TonB family protein
MKKVVLLLFGVFASIAVSAQKKQNVYFFKNNVPVSDKDSADLIRIIQEPDSGSTLYSLFEFHKNGKRKTVAALMAYEPSLQYDGPVSSFYDNGKRKSYEQYTFNFLSGEASYYFENGTLEKSVNYVSNPPFASQYKLLYLADSLGHVLVKDGNGHVLRGTSDYIGWQEAGDYVAGKKHGVWKTTDSTSNSSYQETLDRGVFVKGTSLVDGISYDYKQIFEAPSIIGGMQAFYKQMRPYLSKFKTNKQNLIAGKVYVSFVVDRDGSVVDVKVVKSLDYERDRLALEFIKSSPKWIPGRYHGIPQRVKYNIPVSFDGQ